ncbi:MAG: SRPBCC domain-containing protein [Thermodesulfovibrionales bacterium]
MEDIILEQTYTYPIQYVWEALTDPVALADWLMPGDFKPVVGHKVTFHCDPLPEFDGTVEVEVLEVDKPHRLSYSWKTSNMKKPTKVIFYLTPTRDGGTHLRLEHKGFEDDSGKIMHDLFKSGWGHKLDSQLGPAIDRLARKRD